MRKIKLLKTFKKDYNKVKKQQWNLEAIDETIKILKISLYRIDRH